MRIAVITNAYPPTARGGAGQVAASLVELWRASGHEVRVWESYASWLSRGAISRLYGHLVSDRGAANCLPEVFEWKPDLVVTHNLTGIGFGTGRAVQARGIRWLHILHDVQLFEPSGQLSLDQISLWQRFWSRIRRSRFGMPDLVVSPTKWLLNAHAKRGFVFQQIAVIPNPAPKGDPSLRLTPFRMTGGGGGDEGRDRAGWLFVGMREEKGVYFIQHLAERFPNELFIVIGDGPLRTIFSHLKNVLYRGALTRDQVCAQMATSYALLMPSCLQENQPNVIIEAFQNGLPVIASSYGGIPETVDGAGIILDLFGIDWEEGMKQMKSEW